MVYISRIFKKEITIKIIGDTEENINYVVQHIKNVITKRFYACDTEVVEGKLMVKNDKNQARIQIDYFEHQLKALRHQKTSSRSEAFRKCIDDDIETIKNEIQKLKKLL